MEISINQQHLDHIKRKVESGIYRSPDAVIAKALGLLDEHDESLAEEMDGLRGKVQGGIEALRNGDCTEYTNETLRELFDEVTHPRSKQPVARELRVTSG